MASISTDLQRRCLPSRGAAMSSRMSSCRLSRRPARPPPFHARSRREPDRSRGRAGAAVRRLCAGPTLERRRPVLARRRLRRAAAGRLRAVDAACARSAVARSGDAGRHDRRRCAGDLRDRRRSGRCATSCAAAPRRRSACSPIPCMPDVRGLPPGRSYWYRFVCGDAASPVGRAMTTAPAGTPLRAHAVRLRLLLPITSTATFPPTAISPTRIPMS